jgi:photosystem II stability/assembly factor-like uncharacterized protein
VKKAILFLFTLFLLFSISKGKAQEGFLIKISSITSEKIEYLRDSGILVYAKTADFYLAEATNQNLDYLKTMGISYKILDDVPEFSLYFFVWARGNKNINEYLDKIREKAILLDAEGQRAIIKGHPKKIEELSSFGLSTKLIKRKPLPLEKTELLPTFEKAATTFSPIIDTVIQKVTTSELYNWVDSLSGEHPVTIGGSPCTIATRYTYANGNDKAAQFLKERFESLGLTAWYDTLAVLSYPTYVMDIVSTPDGNTAWLGCLNTGIWKTTDAGTSWYNITGTDIYDLWALSIPAPETLYAVGNGGVVIKSTDNGDSWSLLSSPTLQFLRGVYFEDTQNGWITGYGGTIYFTSDGGQNWTNQSTGSANLYEITFVDSDNGWVVGGSGTILHTTDRGTNWLSQTSGTGGIIFGIDFATPYKGWICAENGYIAYTTNAGTNWNSQISGTTQRLYMVSTVDSLNVWISGLGGRILKTTNSGANWVNQAVSYNTGSFYEVYFLNAQKGWVTGYNDILYTTNAGSNWTQQVNNTYPRYYKYNVVAELPGKTRPKKECLITAHYDDTSEDPMNSAPGADDNGSGTATVLTAANILRNYDFNYTLKFVCFTGEEQGLLGSEVYAERAKARGDTIVGVYNLDMIAWDGNNDNIIEVHSGTMPSSQALADIFIDVKNHYSLPLVIQEITTGATDRSDHASFWNQNYPAILGIEDFDDFNPYYHNTNDLLSIFDLPYFTAFGKAGIASVSILAQPYYFCGDANNDKIVDIGDIVYLINYVFYGGSAPLYDSDVNNDGVIDIGDIVLLINYVFYGGLVPNC